MEEKRSSLSHTVFHFLVLHKVLCLSGARENIDGLVAVDTHILVFEQCLQKQTSTTTAVTTATITVAKHWQKHWKNAGKTLAKTNPRL